MITSFLIFVVLSIFNALLQFFPQAEPVPSLSAATTWIAQQLSTASSIFPVDTLLLCLGFVLAFETVLLGIKVIMLVAGFIRGGH